MAGTVIVVVVEVEVELAFKVGGNVREQYLQR
jgi:hypothetical protein